MSARSHFQYLRQVATVAVLTLAVASCAGQTRTESDFGQSVLHMVQQQTYDPKAAARPTEELPPMDGARAAVVLKAYQTPDAKSVKPELPIQGQEVR